MSLKIIFIVNLLFGIFACLAHLPLVIFKLTGSSGFESVNLWQVLPLIPIDLALLIGAIAALAGSEQLKLKILPVHAVIMGLFSMLIIGMLFWFIFIGFPSGNFSWSAGLGAVTVGYSVARRLLLDSLPFITGRALWALISPVSIDHFNRF